MLSSNVHSLTVRMYSKQAVSSVRLVALLSPHTFLHSLQSHAEVPPTALTK